MDITTNEMGFPVEIVGFRNCLLIRNETLNQLYLTFYFSNNLI